jgi:hypothetical protein
VCDWAVGVITFARSIAKVFNSLWVDACVWCSSVADADSRNWLKDDLEIVLFQGITWSDPCYEKWGLNGLRVPSF